MEKLVQKAAQIWHALDKNGKNANNDCKLFERVHNSYWTC